MRPVAPSLVVAGLLLACSTAAQRPNVVLLIGDDHGFPYFGFTGSEHVVTPHLDRLAYEGAVFFHGHTTDNHCRPALQTLATGLYPFQYAMRAESLRGAAAAADSAAEPVERARRDRIFLSQVMQEFETLPTLLSQAGYASMQAGKWWERGYGTGGFTEGMSESWEFDAEGRPESFRALMGGLGVDLGRVTMDPVYDFIDRHREQPFFLWFGPSLPHTPLNPPQEHIAHYANSTLSSSAQEYYGNCTWFDATVGALMAYLKRAHLLDRTLVIYVNDNGWEQPPHLDYTGDRILYANGGDHGKLSLHDQAFRTPVLFWWPGVIAPQSHTDVLVSTVDLMPTILDYAGVPVPEYLPGVSLRPVIEGQIELGREVLVGRVTQLRSETSEFGQAQEGYYVRTLRWHFTFTTGQTRLYDLTGDPYADVSQQYAELVPGFLEHIAAWKQDMTDSVTSISGRYR